MKKVVLAYSGGLDTSCLIRWYKNKGFPAGTLGEQLKLVYELKLNGLEEVTRLLTYHKSKVISRNDSSS